MQKSRILLIGSGRCGNHIVNDMIEMDGRYTGLFMNTTEVDLADLPHANTRNTFIIPNASGTGKNRNLAKEYVIEEEEKVADRIMRYNQQDVIIAIASADGGSGSGITPLLMNVTKHMTEDKTINLVAVLPRYDEGKRSIENTLDFWNEVATLYKQGVINSIMLVDNNKRNTDEEINEKLVVELDACLGAEGLTDETDSWVVNNDIGYKIVLDLEEGYDTVEEAIDNCIKESVFVYPDEGFKRCNSILGVMNPEAYDLEEAKEQYVAREFKKFGASDEFNTLILGGCRIPKEAIDVYVNLLKEANKESALDNDDLDDLTINTESITPKKKVPKTKTINKKPSARGKSLKDKLKDRKIWEI